MKTLTLALVMLASGAFAQDIVDLVNEGIAFHDQGEYAKAIEKYREALTIEPNNGNVYYEMAYSYHLLQDYVNALEAANQAIAFSGPEIKLLAMMVKGSALDDMGLAEESARSYETALKEYPDSYLLLYNYGVTLSKLSRLYDAEAVFERALTKNFEHPGSHLGLANLRRSENRNVPASLGVYYFLFLESNTERATIAASNLLKWIYGAEPDSLPLTVVKIPRQASHLESSFANAEHFFNLMGRGKADDETTVKGAATRSSQINFVADTKSYFTMISDLAEQVKRKGKTRKINDAAFRYMHFFTALNQAGHTEALCYHIMAGTGNPEVTEWLNANQGKLRLLFRWFETTGKSF